MNQIKITTIMPSKDVRNLTSEYSECATLYGTMDFADWCCDFSGVREWVQSIHKRL